VIVFTKQSEGANTYLDSDLKTVTVTKPWKVTFGKTGVTKTMPQLASWTADDATKYYSGKATYESKFVLPRGRMGAVYLSLGHGKAVDLVERRSGNGMRAMFESPVHEAARVWINDKYAGSIWCAPYEVYIGNLLKPGNNAIRIEVANLALNELAKGPLPDYRTLNAKYGERFQPQDMKDVQPLPAGLLEPVTILVKAQRTP
jgi:hypothetical protein